MEINIVPGPTVFGTRNFWESAARPEIVEPDEELLRALSRL